MKINNIFYFQHIPKTGGVSFSRLLETYFPPHKVCPITFIEDLSRQPRKTLRQYRLFRGHFGHFLKDFVSGKIIYLTLLRDATDRILSFCKYIRGDPTLGFGDVVRRCPIFGDFLRDPEIAPLLDNVQTINLLQDSSQFPLTWIPPQGYLSRASMTARCRELNSQLSGTPDSVLIEKAKKRLKECAFIGLTERMEDSVRLLCHTFHWKMCDNIPRLNASRGQLRPEELTEGVLGTLKRLTRLDTEVYVEAQRLFEERFSSMNGSQSSWSEGQLSREA